MKLQCIARRALENVGKRFVIGLIWPYTNRA